LDFFWKPEKKKGNHVEKINGKRVRGPTLPWSIMWFRTERKEPHGKVDKGRVHLEKQRLEAAKEIHTLSSMEGRRGRGHRRMPPQEGINTRGGELLLEKRFPYSRRGLVFGTRGGRNWEVTKQGADGCGLAPIQNWGGTGGGRGKGGGQLQSHLGMKGASSGQRETKKKQQPKRQNFNHLGDKKKKASWWLCIGWDLERGGTSTAWGHAPVNSKSRFSKTRKKKGEVKEWKRAHLNKPCAEEENGSLFEGG